MPIVLDVNILPRQALSRTRRLHDAFFAAWKQKHPDGDVIALNLAEDYRQLPVFDEWDIAAKFEMLYGEGSLDEQSAERWAILTRLTDQLHAADLVVISTPMWNFSVPWHLKRWIDCVVQGRLTFEWADGAFRGLLAGRPLVILASRDGVYKPGTPEAAFDFQIPYLRTIMGFVGLGPIHEVIAEPMVMGGPEVGAHALEAGIARAAELGSAL